jgi:nitrite reductase/ring-hydroxylating ferredoxin subunit
VPDHQRLPPEPGGALPHVGGYRRVLPVSLERLFENALDWEHLPYVHAARFASIRCIDAGPWGWRAAVTDSDGRSQLVELRLDRSIRRWITRVLEGSGAGAEVWTQAAPMGEQRVDIVVDFFVPGVAVADRRRVGEAYAALYEELYDDDVAMMVERQRQLDRRMGGVRAEDRVMVLGDLRSLELPHAFRLGGRDYVLVRAEDELFAFPRQCPHQLGPLSDGPVHGATVTCPWHGYRFDLRSGENLSGQSCRLEHRPTVMIDSAGVVSAAV